MLQLVELQQFAVLPLDLLLHTSYLLPLTSYFLLPTSYRRDAAAAAVCRRRPAPRGLTTA